jgi:DNA-binding NtrC family response regulator
VTARKPVLLVVDDEADVRYSFHRLFGKADYEVVEAGSGREAAAMVRERRPDVVLMDIRMPDGDGIASLREIRAFDARTPVILMTAYASTQSTIEAMKAGAFDYVLKPFDIDKIRSVVQAAVKVSHDMRQKVSYQPLLSREQHEEEIVGASDAMQEVCKLIGRVSNSELPVLITGESGTGKELVARAIYQHSLRSQKPFLAVNCGAIPESLLESELFGYHRGAFTGAQAGKPGKFEVCDGGTILLDEIGEMPQATQAKLLRVLETGDIEKIGGTRAAKVDVRVIAATNRDLRESIEKGGFRADLFYRLRVVEIHIPPLRQRAADIPALTEYFLRRHAEAMGLAPITMDRGALDALTRYPFPGNVRELENIIKNCLVRLNGTVVFAKDLELGSPGEGANGDVALRNLADESVFDMLFEEIARRQPLPPRTDAFDIVERKLIVRALDDCGGNQSRAARFLGITRNTLRKRIQKYDLKIERSVADPDE